MSEQLMIDGRRWQNIWCDHCRVVRPMYVEIMPADDRNAHTAIDLVCQECHWIVATLHGAGEGDDHEDAPDGGVFVNGAA